MLLTILGIFILSLEYNEWPLPYVEGGGSETLYQHIDGFVQERRNSIANALELVFLALTHRHELPLWRSEEDPRWEFLIK